MSNDRRRNFRFAVQPELREAQLLVRGERVEAEIIEQSAGGFRVSVTSGIKLAINDPVDLETWAGSCHALVAYVEDAPGSRRVGLERTSDIMPRRGGWLRALWRRRKKPAKARTGSWGRGALVGGSVVAALVVGGWLSNYLIAEGRLAAIAGSGEPAAEDPAALGEAAQLRSVADKQLAPADAPGAQRTADDPIEVLERLVSLQKKEVATELELSEYQKLQISRLVADTARSLNRLQARRGGRIPTDRGAKIGALLTRADERADEILTPQQRDRWRCESAAAGDASAAAVNAAGR